MTENRKSWTRWVLYAAHALIIANFLFEICYAAFMIFAVFAPEGSGPLFARALDFPHDKMVTRRLYAIEFWIAAGGLSIYLALTEIGPRLRKLRG